MQEGLKEAECCSGAGSVLGFAFPARGMGWFNLRSVWLQSTVYSMCGSWFALCHVLALQGQHEDLGCKRVAPEPCVFMGLKLRAALLHQELLLCSDFKAKFSPLTFSIHLFLAAGGP